MRAGLCSTLQPSGRARMNTASAKQFKGAFVRTVIPSATRARPRARRAVRLSQASWAPTHELFCLLQTVAWQQGKLPQRQACMLRFLVVETLQ